MVRNPAVKPGSKPKYALFTPKTGWVSAGMALFSDEKMDTFVWIFYRNQWVGMLRFIQMVEYRLQHRKKENQITSKWNQDGSSIRT